jgi:ABC-2 type transport system ATP-binding protein
MVEARDKQISELSAGMRQKITLARGFLLDRPVLYLDEPSVSLDVPSARDLREMLATYVVGADKTLLIASNNPADLAICDRCLLLHRGRVLAVGAMDELRAPLAGIEALHVTCAHQRPHLDLAQVRAELLALDGVRSVWDDAPRTGGGNGQAQTWQARILVRQDRHPTGAIVDRLIARELPIVAMRTCEVTLQEIYQTHVEAADAD